MSYINMLMIGSAVTLCATFAASDAKASLAQRAQVDSDAKLCKEENGTSANKRAVERTLDALSARAGCKTTYEKGCAEKRKKFCEKNDNDQLNILVEDIAEALHQQEVDESNNFGNKPRRHAPTTGADDPFVDCEEWSRWCEKTAAGPQNCTPWKLNRTFRVRRSECK